MLEDQCFYNLKVVSRYLFYICRFGLHDTVMSTVCVMRQEMKEQETESLLI